MCIRDRCYIEEKKGNEVFFMGKKFEVSEFALEAVRHFEFSGTLINVRPFGNGHINDTCLLYTSRCV